MSSLQWRPALECAVMSLLIGPGSLGFVCVVGIPQFICFPQGITALFRGLEHSEMKAYFSSKTCLSQTPAALTRLTVYVNLNDLCFSLAIKPQDFSTAFIIIAPSRPPPYWLRTEMRFQGTTYRKCLYWTFSFQFLRFLSGLHQEFVNSINYSWFQKQLFNPMWYGYYWNRSLLLRGWGEEKQMSCIL